MSLVPKGEKLSVVYDKMTKMGWMPAFRRVNDGVTRKHFEEKCGMVVLQDSSSLLTWATAGVLFAGLAIAATVTSLRHRSN
jgi:hypothetical protein